MATTVEIVGAIWDRVKQTQDPGTTWLGIYVDDGKLMLLGKSQYAPDSYVRHPIEDKDLAGAFTHLRDE